MRERTVPVGLGERGRPVDRVYIESFLEDNRERLGTPWEEAKGDPAHDLRDFAHGLKGFINAWKQVAQAGTPEQRLKAQAVVDDARKAMYRILADDES